MKYKIAFWGFALALIAASVMTVGQSPVQALTPTPSPTTGTPESTGTRSPTPPPPTVVPTPIPAPTQSDARVTSIDFSPDDPNVGDTINVVVTVTNFGDSAAQMNLELTADEILVDSQSVSIAPKNTRQVQLSFVPDTAGDVLLSMGGLSKLVSVKEKPGVGPIGVGPTVRLQTNRNVVTSLQDALIDIFWDNSIINNRDYVLEVYVSVPDGLYLYSQLGGMACGAGTCKGLFEIPPGSVRNLPIIVKAEAVGDKFIHMEGRYFPKDDPSQWNPISLSTTIRVEAPSPSPETQEPTSVSTPTPGRGFICNASPGVNGLSSAGLGELALGGVLLGGLWVWNHRKKR